MGNVQRSRRAEREAIGTSYFFIRPSDFALALSSRLLVAPKRWRRWIVFEPDLNLVGAKDETGMAERPTSWEARSQDVEVSGRRGALYGGRHRNFECVQGSRARLKGIERLSRFASSS